MARKNLLRDLMNSPGPARDADLEGSGETAGAQPQRPRYSKGAIGAVSQSIAELKARAISEIDPFAIEDGGVTDRLEDDDRDAHERLMASLRDHGQQVPVLVRPHPEAEGRFQIVFGRRRVKALRDLGLPVKAMIRHLDDQELVVAQGQENAARKDLTFIEKANFARQMRDAAYDRKVICDALHVDKTQVSRMLSVADAVPLAVIEAIGSAPSVGRDRWLTLAKLLSDTATDADGAVALVAAAKTHGSDERFAALMRALRQPRSKPTDAAPEAETVSGALRNREGAEIGRLSRRGGKITLTLPEAEAAGFDRWLMENFDRLHGDWLASRPDKDR